MIKDGKVFFNGIKDRNFIIAESVESLHSTMFDRLSAQINQEGKLEFERTKSKEEIINIIYELLRMGFKLKHELKPSDKMVQYFEDMFDAECIIEYFNRRYRTYQWDDNLHDYRYIEQDKPLASDQDIEVITNFLIERQQAKHKPLKMNG